MLLTIFLQQKSSGGGYETLVMLGLIIIVFYFFMIRPQQKKAKEQKVFRENIKRGDSVVTIGGLHGKVLSVDSDDTITLEVDKGVRLKFEKSAISPETTKKVQTPAAS